LDFTRFSQKFETSNLKQICPVEATLLHVDRKTCWSQSALYMNCVYMPWMGMTAKQSWPILTFFSSTGLKGMTKATRNFRHASQSC